MKPQRQPIGTSRKQAIIEWSMVSFMVLLGVGLTALQYRWTGEVGRAEFTRLRASLETQVKNLCQEFDTELSHAYEELVPSVREIESEGGDVGYLERFRKWTQLNPRPVFHRIAVAISTNETLQLLELDQKQARFASIEWPESWITLRDNLSQKLHGPGRPGGPGGPSGPGQPPKREGRGAPPDDYRGPPPDRRRGPGGPRANSGGPGFDGPGGIFFDPTGQLVEFPIFSAPAARGGPPEMQWLIFELDMNYATNSWLPELVGRYQSRGGRLVNDIAVTLVASPQTVLFSTTPNPSAIGRSSPAPSFNPQFGLGRRRGERPVDGRWSIQVSQRPNALDAIVAESRRRNLGLAVVLNGLMLTAGLFLVRYTRRSRELAERQMHFVANVSHELRTPLTVIQGAGENLARGIARDPAAIKDYSQLIMQHAKQLQSMVEQVLAFASAKQGQLQAAQQRVSIGQILGEAVAAVTHDIELADCEVSLELPPDLPPVCGDALALGRVFQNLISNAAKHGAEGKWIGVMARRLEGGDPMVEVEVSDRGPGLAKKEQGDIFQPFVRGAQAQEQGIRGSGLGLSVVREIVEAHGGTVSIHSAPQQGATFVVRLPVAPPPP